MEKNEKNIAQVLADSDAFPVPWAGRNEKGSYTLSGMMFKVNIAPPPMFGKNIDDFGIEVAELMAENGPDYGDHDFGECVIQQGSLSRLTDGHWYLKLVVENPRYCKVQTMDLDPETGEPIIGEDGRPQVNTSTRRETRITVPLTAIEPLTEHPGNRVYHQYDPRGSAMLRSAKQSEKKDPTRKKPKRVRVTPGQIAEVMARLEGKVSDHKPKRVRVTPGQIAEATDRYGKDPDAIEQVMDRVEAKTA